MKLPTVQNQDRVLLRDCTVLSITGTGSTTGATVAFLGQAAAVKINLKREFADVTAAADGFTSRRVIRWGEGAAEISGFSQLAGSKFAALFAQGGTAILQFAESSTGDVYQLICCAVELDKEMGLDATKDRIRLAQIGTPQYASSGGTPENIPLEAS
jgi:hypothetical protein